MRAPSSWPVALVGSLLACGSSSPDDPEPEPESGPAPVQVGTIRTVDTSRLDDPDQWGTELDLAVETEFWDIVGNSAHADYPAWRAKTKAYLAANADADPRLDMLIAAGGVFRLTTLFEATNPLAEIAQYTEDIEDATVGIRDAVEPLRGHEPAVVFFHNNQAMLAFLLQSDADLGICHLEKLRNLEDDSSFFGSEGRAAAPFTYAMVNDDAYVDYAIELMEGCDTWICNWTSKLAPFKPIGQLMTLAEFHSFKAASADSDAARDSQLVEMNRLLDRAEMLGLERDYPFLSRIDRLREELPSRRFTQGIGLGRSPMPIYSDRDNCATCHIGGVAGRYGEAIDDAYAFADVTTQRPPAPGFSSGSGDCE